MTEGLDLALLEKLGLYKPIDYEHKRFEALKSLCNESEIIFWSCGYFEICKYGTITPQYPVDHYRIDFAVTEIPDTPLLKIAIELDGQDWHKTKEQRQSDYKRQRYLERKGWKFIRFTGVDVYNEPQACVQETIELIQEYIKWLWYK